MELKTTLSSWGSSFKHGRLPETSKRLEPFGQADPFPVAPVLLAVSSPFQGCHKAGLPVLNIAISLWYSSLSSCHLYLPVWHQWFLCRSRPTLSYVPFLWQKCRFTFLCLPPVEWLIWGRSGKTNWVSEKKKNVPRHLIALYFILDFTISTSVIREMRIRLYVDILSSHFWELENKKEHIIFTGWGWWWHLSSPDCVL